MDSQPCHCRPQTLEDITGYLMLQIDDSLKFSIKSVANKRRIASRLSSNCNGMAYLADLWFSAVESSATSATDIQINDTWLDAYCGTRPKEEIFQVMLDNIAEDPKRKSVARHFILGVLRRGLPHGTSLINSLDPENSMSFFGRLPNQVSDYRIQEACSGFITICERSGCNKWDMSEDLRAWFLDTNSWQTLFSQEELDHAKYAEEALEEIHTAFKDSAPCPDDATWEALIQQRQHLPSSVQYFGYHMKHAGSAMNGRCDILDKTKRMHQYLPCLMQAQVAVTDERHLRGYSQRYRQGVSLFWLAAAEGLDFVLQQMLDLGENLNLERRDMGGLTPLAIAAMNGRSSTVKILIGEKANIEARDLAGDTPLALASFGGHIDIVNELVSHGADTLSRSNDLSTPAIIAASNLRLEICGVLMHSRCGWTAADVNGETILSHMIRHGLGLNPTGNYKPGGAWEGQYTPKSLAAIYRALFDLEECSNWEGYENGLDHAGGDTPLLGYVPGALRNRYILQHKLGKGAFGICLSAIDRLTGRTCAIKASQFHRSIDPELRETRYQTEQDELQLLKDLNHENIASLENFVDANKYVFMISEKADCNLSEHFAKEKMSDDQIRDMLKQLLEGLRYMHNNDLIHCDLKPDNILVYDDGKTFKLTDFGNSRRVLKDHRDEKLVKSVSGTRIYSAPEASGSHERRKRGLKVQPIRGPPCDIHAIGTILLEAFGWRSAWEELERNIAAVQTNGNDNPENLKREFRIRMHHAWAHTFIKNPKYRSIPQRPKALIEWMRAFSPTQRATIEQIESHFWMQQERLPRMMTEDLSQAKRYLADNKHTRPVGGDLNPLVEYFATHIQQYDAHHISKPAPHQIPPYLFVRMAVYMHGTDLWERESIHALWNGYPQHCLQENEHPFGVQICKWCGWLRVEESKDLVNSPEVEIEEPVTATFKKVKFDLPVDENLERHRIETRKLREEKMIKLEEQREAEEIEEAERYGEDIAQEAERKLDERTDRRGRKRPRGRFARRGGKKG